MEWTDVKRWRKEQRGERIAARLARPLAERKRVRDAVADCLRQEVAALRRGRIAFYWPIRAELDLRDLVAEMIGGGVGGALPVVVTKNAPLEFWDWTPETQVTPGFWNIPVPAARAPVTPDVLLVPLVGFDRAGYRLGYGGGYYDRTLAGFAAKPLAIGVGYAADGLDSIHPQPHDIPMDAIVTDEGIRWRTWPAGLRHEDPLPLGAASPPCLMHEADPAYMGFLSDAETLAFLNELLEGERAGARGALEMARATVEMDLRVALSAVASDEARFCAMLHRHVQRLGGEPSGATGAFLTKLRDTPGGAAKLDLLNRGQGWVVRRLRRMLPKIADPELHRDLRDMLEAHDRNILRCARFCREPA